jgi:hypothetical protein
MSVMSSSKIHLSSFRFSFQLFIPNAIRIQTIIVLVLLKKNAYIFFFLDIGFFFVIDLKLNLNLFPAKP